MRSREQLMSKISQTFTALKAKRQAAYMPFMTIGFPTLTRCRELVLAMVEAGADILELGVPFSDPLADGPTIQSASQVALANGVSVKSCLHFVEDLRRSGVTIPIVLMGYANPFLAYGIESIASDAARAGADGFIIPDLPPDYADEWLDSFRNHGLDLIFFAAPNTSRKRLSRVLGRATGFVYCISVNGVTGARNSVAENLPELISSIRSSCSLPVCVGFGISTTEQVTSVVALADGVIVASALINLINSTPYDNQINELTKTVRAHKAATLKG
jgi:tryptophan synthase alpha chain